VKNYLVDTDIYSLYLRREPTVVESVARHAEDNVAIPIIVVQEIWGGWSTAIVKAKSPEELAHGYTKLTETIDDLKTWKLATYPATAIKRYQTLKNQKLNVGTNDLKIAAIALEAGAIVVTHNVRDFKRIPGLAIEDWAVTEKS
jgi:tRNA(fMet)-specific endonuclease VapC